MGTRSVSPYVDLVAAWLADDPQRADRLVAATSVGVGATWLGFLGGIGFFAAVASWIGAMDWFGRDPIATALLLVALPAAGWIGMALAARAASTRWHRILGIRPATSMVLGLSPERLWLWRAPRIRRRKLELLLDIPRDGISATKPLVGGRHPGRSPTALEGLAGLSLHLPDGGRLTLLSSRGFSAETRRVIAELNQPGSTVGLPAAELPRWKPDADPSEGRLLRILLVGLIVALGVVALRRLL